MNKRIVMVILAVSWIATCLAYAGATNIRTYPLPDHGNLTLQVPVGWSDQVQQPPRQLPPTITFGQNGGASFAVLLTPIWAMGNKALPSGQELQQMVKQMSEVAGAQAVEKTIEIKEMKGTSGAGFFFSVTDRAPKPGEYKFLAQGAIRVGALMITFTILTNDNQTDIVANALSMLKSAVHDK